MVQGFRVEEKFQDFNACKGLGIPLPSNQAKTWASSIVRHVLVGLEKSLCIKLSSGRNEVL